MNLQINIDSSNKLRGNSCRNLREIQAQLGIQKMTFEEIENLREKSVDINHNTKSEQSFGITVFKFSFS